MYVSRRWVGIQRSWNLYPLLVGTYRVTWWTGFSSDCCDNTPPWKVRTDFRNLSSDLTDAMPFAGLSSQTHNNK